MSQSPLISVIMPVHNCGDWLRPAVQSILDQSCRDFELLLVDDHSYDGSIQTLPRDPRLKVLRHAGSGIVASLNFALRQAQGRFIARMDGDDISLPERFQQQLAYAENHPDVSVIGGRVKIFSESQVEAGFRQYESWLNSLTEPDELQRDLFIESPLVHPSVLIRRQLFDDIGLYRDLSWPEDYDLWLRAFLQGHKMGKVSDTVLRWRDHSSRLTRQDKRYAKKEFIKAKAWALSESLLRHRPVFLCGTGQVAVKLHDVLTALQVSVLGFVDIAPHKISKTRRNLPIHSLEDMLEIRGNAMVVGAIGARGAGAQLRQLLLSLGLLEIQDFILAA